MKETRSSLGRKNMKNKIDKNFEARLTHSDPAKYLKSPILNESVITEVAMQDGKSPSVSNKHRKLTFALTGSAVALLVVAPNIHFNTNGEEKALQESQSLVLTENPNVTGQMGVFWHPGQVAAEYNYRLTGLDNLNKDASSSKAYLVLPQENIPELALKLAASLGIESPSIAIDSYSDEETETRYSDSKSGASLRVYSSGRWSYSNPDAKNRYGNIVHSNNVCQSEEFSSCFNSWKDVLDLPSKDIALNVALPILRAGGFRGPESKISASHTTSGVPEGRTDVVHYNRPECTGQWQQIACPSTNIEDVANSNYAQFGLRFASGGVVDSAQGAFFDLVSIGSFKTASEFDSIAFLKKYHHGVDWLSSPVYPPASEKRIDLSWEIVSARASLNVWRGLDNDGKEATFIVPAFTYEILPNGNSQPFALTFPSIGKSPNEGEPASKKSKYQLPEGETICKIEAFGWCF